MACWSERSTAYLGSARSVCKVHEWFTKFSVEPEDGHHRYQKMDTTVGRLTASREELPDVEGAPERKYQEEGPSELDGTCFESASLKSVYTFTNPASGDSAREYDIASDNDVCCVLVLLNVSQNPALPW
ncbi:hypothetical protein BV898_02888 [Hypsibius exemplaris]|uniref:Uncharacterized protein n=1 Tax=Hypsibius exemplaris TaxID=2072580 RepID=A0A1W0X6X4_HYPEX|nr:hypothetical protein BV898_02888 [Hypsibius exemplaris]